MIQLLKNHTKSMIQIHKIHVKLMIRDAAGVK